MEVKDRINDMCSTFIREKLGHPNTLYMGREEEDEILHGGDRLGALELALNKNYEGMDVFIVNEATHLFVTKR